ncbi:MAG: pilus assembly protein PilM [Candidatus Omnitrophica bacterium]|nr:pilus assembly protein PilM [Candidatus Omnitrophota bacterium]
MAKSSVGIYISPKYIDIVELSGSMHTPHLLNFIRQDIPPAAMQEIPVSSQEEQSQEAEENQDKRDQGTLSLMVKEGFSQLKTQAQGVYTVLSLSDAMIRYFDMPFLPKSEQEQAVKFESKKYIPFKLEDIVSDFKTLSASREKKSMNVFFIAATKQRLQSHVTLFKNAGSDTLGIDIIPFSLMRMLILSKKVQPKESVAVLYLDNDKESASIHMMEMGMPFLSRDLKISNDDKEAFFEKLASEIRVSIDYYRRQRPHAEVSKIVVCGEHIFAGLDAYIADELKIITETLTQFESLRAGEKADPSAVIAIGTALGGLGKSNYSVNLSPSAAATKRKRTASMLVIEAIAALAIITAVFLFNSLRVAGVYNELKVIEEEGISLPEETAGIDAQLLTELKEKRLEYIASLQVIVDDRIPWAQKLSQIAGALSEGVWIKKLLLLEQLIQRKEELSSAWARTISLEGSSFLAQADRETDAINKFFKALKDDKGFMKDFDDIELGSVGKDKISDNWVTSFKILVHKDQKLTSDTDRTGRSRWQRR